MQELNKKVVWLVSSSATQSKGKRPINRIAKHNLQIKVAH